MPSLKSTLVCCSQIGWAFAAMDFWFRRGVSDEHTLQRSVRSEQRSLNQKDMPPGGLHRIWLLTLLLLDHHFAEAQGSSPRRFGREVRPIPPIEKPMNAREPRALRAIGVAINSNRFHPLCFSLGSRRFVLSNEGNVSARRRFRPISCSLRDDCLWVSLMTEAPDLRRHAEAQ